MVHWQRQWYDVYGWSFDAYIITARGELWLAILFFNLTLPLNTSLTCFPKNVTQLQMIWRQQKRSFDNSSRVKSFIFFWKKKFLRSASAYFKCYIEVMVRFLKFSSSVCDILDASFHTKRTLFHGTIEMKDAQGLTAFSTLQAFMKSFRSIREMQKQMKTFSSSGFTTYFPF